MSCKVSQFVEVSVHDVNDVNDSKRCKLPKISLRYTSKSDFGTVLGKRKNAMRRRQYQHVHARIVCERHARKQHSRLQSRMEFRGFRANVSPLAIYIYIYTYHFFTNMFTWAFKIFRAIQILLSYNGSVDVSALWSKTICDQRHGALWGLNESEEHCSLGRFGWKKKPWCFSPVRLQGWFVQ